MPNHCQNELVIDVATYKAALEIWDAIKNGSSNAPDFGRIIPYPQKFQDLDAAAEAHEKEHGKFAPGRPKDGFNSGGYEWCCENWGTKWNAYQGEALELPTCDDEENYPDDGTTTIVVQFQTAWAPPTPVVAAIAARWPDAKVSLQFWERGMEYQGLQMWEGGEQTIDFKAPYHGHRGG